MKKFGKLYIKNEMKKSAIDKLNDLNIPYTENGLLLWVEEKHIKNILQKTRRGYLLCKIKETLNLNYELFFYEIKKEDIMFCGNIRELRKNNLEYLLESNCEKI